LKASGTEQVACSQEKIKGRGMVEIRCAVNVE
jgi:hypothetical protein